MTGTVNLHVYPAPIVNESRIAKETQAILDAGVVASVVICGTAADALPAVEPAGAGRRIERIGRPRGGRPSGVVARVWQQFSWSVRVYRRYARTPLTIVNAHSVAVLPVCAALARRHRATLVYDTHELETETVASRGLQQRIFKVLERRLIRSCALVLTVDESIAQWYRDAYPGVDPVAVRNVPEVKEMPAVDVKAVLGIPQNRILYSHVGRITEGRSIEQILDAFAGPGDGPHVVFIGDGPLRSRVEQLAARNARIHWIPSVPGDEVVGYVRGCDAGLCLIEPTCLSYELSLPNKAFEYALAGRPFLYTPLPEIVALVGDELPGWAIADPAGELTGAVDRLDSSAVDAGQHRLTGRRWPTWDGEAERMIDAYREVLGSREGARR
ncbi:glycosyltransferase [uncultured Leifsonia sp.]|uniref:glycosyltransferase n=1 Tax=uncultured Leifsonia sp. TaxID=340359 RepID=UPI0028D036C0|nr:glycosyltransferase [uncultured Leifsonia sp.]